MAAQRLGLLGSSADRNLLEVALKVEQHMGAFLPSRLPCGGSKLALAVMATLTSQHLDLQM